MGVGDMRRFAVGSLADILDLVLTAPSVGDVLLFESGQWKNKTLANAGIAAASHIHANATTEVAGFMSATDKTKLNGIESGATADQTANEILTALLGVDGPGCLLDSDLLDGLHGSSYFQLAASQTITGVPTFSPSSGSQAFYLGPNAIHMTKTTTDSYLRLSANIAHIVMYGSTHATNPGDISLRMGGAVGVGNIYFQYHNGTSWANVAWMDNAGNLRLDGAITTDGRAHITQPSDMWSSSGTWYGVDDLGAMYTDGSYRLALTCNGYRNSSGFWTSYGVNGYTGAAVLELDPNGLIYFRLDDSKATGDAHAVDLAATMRYDGRLYLGSTIYGTNVSLVINTQHHGVESYGIYAIGEVQSDVTSYYYTYYSSPNIVAGYTLPVLRHYVVTEASYAGALTQQIGFFCGSLSAGTSNYGFYGDVAEGTNRYNLYMAGTAWNYLVGRLGVGVAPDSNYTLKLGGSAYMNGQLELNCTNPYIYLHETDQGANLKRWLAGPYNQKFLIQSRNDDGTWLGSLFALDRSGKLTLGANIACGNTTVCTNLNADLLDGVEGASYLRKDSGGIITTIHTISSATPYFKYTETDQAEGDKNWQVGCGNGYFAWYTYDDSWGSGFTAFSISRAGNLQIGGNNIQKGNSTSYMGLMGGAGSTAYGASILLYGRDSSSAAGRLTFGAGGYDAIGEFIWHKRNTDGSSTIQMTLNPSANLYLGGYSNTLSGTKSMYFYQGTAPSPSTNMAALVALDQAPGNTCIHAYSEAGHVVKLYRQALIASPTADAASLKTAVDAIRTLLINNGLMASS